MRRPDGPIILALLMIGCDGVTDVVLRDGGYTQLAVGMWHTCGLTAAGQAFCWGRGAQGQLGNGSTESAALPRRVQSDVDFHAIAAGGTHTCAVADDSSVYCWGSGDHGQVGRTRVTQTLPVRMASTVRFAQVSAGANHTCARSTGGEVFCWGANGQGQSGGGSDVDTPQRITLPRPALTISAGAFHTCAIDDGGRAYCWGGNHAGQLGDGTSRNSSEPREVGGYLFTRVAAGYAHTCAIETGSRALCWGSAVHGELGVGAVSVPGLPGATAPQAVHLGEDMGVIAAGYYASCAARRSGLASCWGRGTEGQLGNGGTRDEWSPIRVSDGDLSADRLEFAMLGVGATHSCGLTATRVIYCWGEGSDGQLGANRILYSPIAQRVHAPQ